MPCSVIYIIDLIMGFHQGVVVRWDSRAVIVLGEPFCKEPEGARSRGLQACSTSPCSLVSLPTPCSSVSAHLGVGQPCTAGVHTCQRGCFAGNSRRL